MSLGARFSLLFALVLSVASVRAEAPLQRLRIATPEPGAVARQLRAQGYDVTNVDSHFGAVELLGDAAAIERLRGLGLDPQPLAPASPSALADYLSPAEIEARLAQYEAAYPGLARRIAYAIDREGRTAWALKISDNVAQEEDEPAVMFVAQTHAREVMTPEVAMDTIDQLLTRYGSDPEITHWVDGAEIFVVPSHNPDGANYVFTANADWRKNRRNNGDGTFGVDLNRNYPFAWGACGGSSDVTGDDTYRGPSANSEPTTQGLVTLARQQRPVYYVSYHTYGPYALHPYGCSGVQASAPDFRVLREMSNEVSARMEADTPGTWFQFGTPWEVLYSVDGDMDAWFYGEIGSMGLTFELNGGAPGGFQPDYATWRDSTVQRARAGWRYYLARLDGPRLTGHVTDACSGLPLPAAGLALAEQTFANGETPRTATPGLARFDWPVVPGTYTLKSSLSGYTTQSWPTAVDFTPAERPIALVPTGRRSAAVASLRVQDSAPGADGDAQADPGETVDVWLTAYATGDAVSGLTASVTSSDPYVTVESGAVNFGALAAGERREAGNAVRVRVAANTPDEHRAALHVTFAAANSLCAAESDTALRVTRGAPGVSVVQEPLDANPWWSIDNGAAPSGWEYGAPVAGVPGAPSAAFTGNAVYGTNLSGNYAPSAHYELVAGPYDLTGVRHAELRFARWLVSEPGFDVATVDVRRGAGGPWTTVWKGFGRDTAWVSVRYDVSSVADGSDAVFVRFTLSSDALHNSVGFYLDDLSVVGERVPIAGAWVGLASAQVDDSDPAYANGNGRLDAGETARLVLTVRNHGTLAAHAVSGVVEPVSAGVTVVDPVVDFADLPAGHAGPSLAPHAGIATSTGCGDAVTLRLTTRWSDGGVHAETFNVPVGQTQQDTLLSDDMETDRGWTPGGSATTGAFVRDDPHGCTSATLGPIRPEDDTTAAPGHICWITGNPAPTSSCPPAGGDVTKGTVWITSPRLDTSGGGRVLLDFSRWLTFTGRSFSGTLEYRAEGSGDDGATWALLDQSLGNFPAWSTQHLEMTGLVPPSAQTRVRFSIKEVLGSGSASSVLAIDDVRVQRRYGVCAAFAAGESHAPHAVGPTLLVTTSGPDVRLLWTAPPADATHDAATFFDVYRAPGTPAGFTIAGAATLGTWRDAGAAAGGTTAFYVVAARNAAGTSGEAP